MMTPHEFGFKTQHLAHAQTVSDQSVNTLSLSKGFQDSIEYRNHSALKIRVKPRQSLASVNIKLMEQRPKTSSNRPNVSYALRSSSNNCEDINLDDYYDKALSAMTREELISGVEHLGVGKDAFRPSTVKRKFKSPNEDATLKTAPTSANIITQEKTNVSKTVSFDKNATQVFNDKRILNNLNKMSQPFDTINIKIRRNKTEMSPAPLRPSSIKATTENETTILLNEKTDHDNILFSHTPINTPHTPKSRISLYNNTNVNVNETKKPRSSLGMRFNYTPKSPRSRPSSIQIGSGKYVEKNEILNPLKKDSPNMIINNLNEEEFIELLKEYRRTKNINLDCVLTLKSTEKLKETSKTPTPSGDFSNRVEDKLKNITKSYTSFDTGHLTDNSNLSKLTYNPISLRLPSQSNLSLDSNVNSSVFNTNNTINNGKYIGDIQVNNIDFANIKTNTLSTNNPFNGKKLPSSFANYLNNKILLKNSKSVVSILINNNNKENAAAETRRVVSSNRLNSTYSHENLHSNENNQNFGRIKILNFPAFAN